MSAASTRQNAGINFGYQIGGFVLLLAVWQMIGAAGWMGKTLPALTDVLHIFTISWRRALLLRAALASLTSAGIGLAAGTLLGLMTAILAHLFTRLEPGLDRLSVVANAVPAVALGPVLIIMAGREATPAFLATIPVFFLIYVAASAGLRSADPQSRRYFRATGASRWNRLLLLDLTSALPALLSGLKIAVTTAMIGTIVGEWFGAPTGLGIVLLNTMQNFQIPLMWATVLVVAGLSLTAYFLVGLLERVVARRLA